MQIALCPIHYKKKYVSDTEIKTAADIIWNVFSAIMEIFQTNTFV
jgi:hypothetical protein